MPLSSHSSMLSFYHCYMHQTTVVSLQLLLAIAGSQASTKIFHVSHYKCGNLDFIVAVMPLFPLPLLTPLFFSPPFRECFYHVMYLICSSLCWKFCFLVLGCQLAHEDWPTSNVSGGNPSWTVVSACSIWTKLTSGVKVSAPPTGWRDEGGWLGLKPEAIEGSVESMCGTIMLCSAARTGVTQF